MKRHIRIFMGGVLIVIPLVVTAWLVSAIGSWLGQLGYTLASTGGFAEDLKIAPAYVAWIGIGIALLGIYLIGLLANFWLFGRFFRLLDRVLSRVPGVQIVYESVRDLLKLFGSDAREMGHVVLYTVPATGQRMLGIVTNEHPAGRPEGDDSVIVYLPMGYMIGGPIVYAHPGDLERLDMPVEVALRLAATAFIGKSTDDEGPSKDLPK